jgi:hypothetical protein
LVNQKSQQQTQPSNYSIRKDPEAKESLCNLIQNTQNNSRNILCDKCQFKAHEINVTAGIPSSSVDENK